MSEETEFFLRLDQICVLLHGVKLSGLIKLKIEVGGIFAYCR